MCHMPCDDPGILNLCYKGVNLAFLPGHCLFGGDHYYLVLCGSKHGGGVARVCFNKGDLDNMQHSVKATHRFSKHMGI